MRIWAASWQNQQNDYAPSERLVLQLLWLLNMTVNYYYFSEVKIEVPKKAGESPEVDALNKGSTASVASSNATILTQFWCLIRNNHNILIVICLIHNNQKILIVIWLSIKFVRFSFCYCITRNNTYIEFSVYAGTRGIFNSSKVISSISSCLLLWGQVGST